MTVVVQTPFNQHVGNGVTTVFGFTFQLLDAGDLQVSVDGVVVGGYSISGLGVQAGGSITLVSPPANLAVVIIRRAIPLARSIDYQVNGDLPSETLDMDIDRLWQAFQDANFLSNLAVQLPVGDAQAPMTLPSVATRQGRFLAFDSLGAAIAADGVTGVPVTAFAATLLDDNSAADARATLNAFADSMSTARILGRTTASTGPIQELTATQVTATFVNAATDTTAGKVELATDTEAQAGTDTTRPVVPAAMKAAQIQLGTAVALSNQTVVDFTGIPSWAKRVTLHLVGVSTNGTSQLRVQGGAGSVDTSSYLAGGVVVQSAVGAGTATAGLDLFDSASAATFVRHGRVVLERATGNTWTLVAVVSNSDTGRTTMSAGSKTFGGTLDRIRLTTVNGTDQFDAGTVNVSWE